MAESKRDWARIVTWGAWLLGVGAVAAALVAAFGSAAEMWGFRAGLTSLRYLFWAAAAGAVLGLIGLVLARRRAKLMLANLVALVVALGFVLYLGNLVRTARSVPAIHDVATNLDDLPQFTRLEVRADNLEKIPDEGKAELKPLPPEERWKAVHRAHYGDLRTVRVATPPVETVRRAAALARDRGWEIALVDEAAGTLEATETSRFFRFKDDVVVRVRPAPGGGSLVDMRSISRVGASDVGVNAERVRRFLADLAAPAS
ncbi:MAG TPA: DUF1499 domain-containing protein [Allosphingosinicella sp.]|nr:DUF1499 domain-containing protein [Allosphingosinicella sp.]